MVALVGSLLRSAREQRGLSLLDAAHATRIPLQRLQWLEQDNYAAFGSFTYARAFLKIYSRFLEVDTHEMLDELPSSRLQGRRSYRHLMANLGPWVPSDATTAVKPVPTGHHSPLFAGLFIFVLMLAGTGYWGHQLAQPQPEMPQSSHQGSTSTSGLRRNLAIGASPSSQAKPDATRPIRHLSPGFEVGMPATVR